MARLLARRHGLRRYSADAHTWEHRDRAVAAGHPAAVRFEALSPAERWSRPPGELLAMSLHHERGPMIADDVRALPTVPLTVVEGTPVTPPAAGAHALWLLPPPGGAAPPAGACLTDQAGSVSGVWCRALQGGGGSQCGVLATDDNAARRGARAREPSLIRQTGPG
ncbi:hypothetical protein GCM10010232_37080 [Streptomyces amakusaensis]|uniref:Uncharacterized protein n=1 Tax=Streptomyces amakusaensis TaxID=67271 RepID=A0ABW0AG26_9ACTN